MGDPDAAELEISPAEAEEILKRPNATLRDFDQEFRYRQVVKRVGRGYCDRPELLASLSHCIVFWDVNTELRKEAFEAILRLDPAWGAACAVIALATCLEFDHFREHLEYTLGRFPAEFARAALRDALEQRGLVLPQPGSERLEPPANLGRDALGGYLLQAAVRPDDDFASAMHFMLRLFLPGASKVELPPGRAKASLELGRRTAECLAFLHEPAGTILKDAKALLAEQDLVHRGVLAAMLAHSACEGVRALGGNELEAAFPGLWAKLDFRQ